MTTTLLLSGFLLLAAAVVQGVIGYGMNLIVAPLFVLVDPSLVPVPVLLVATLNATLATAREHRHVDWRGVAWAMTGRIPGTALGVLAVALLPERPFAAVIGVSVLIGVALSLIAWHPRPTPLTLLVAGVASGTFGTASAIGGPPIALLYQHSAGPTVRATMAVFFALGSTTSLIGLAIGGQVDGEPVTKAALLLPFMVVGFLLSSPLRRIVDAGWMRPAVLAVACGSAVALIARSLLG